MEGLQHAFDRDVEALAIIFTNAKTETIVSFFDQSGLPSEEWSVPINGNTNIFCQGPIVGISKNSHLKRVSFLRVAPVKCWIDNNLPKSSYMLN